MTRGASTRVADGLHRLSLGTVNAFLVEDGRDLLLIDTGNPGSEGKVLAGIAGLGRRPGDLKHIVLTHAHPDHLGSAAALVRATGARTWMHPLDIAIAEGREPQRPITPSPDLFNRAVHAILSRSTPVVEPVGVDERLGDGDALPFAGGLTAVHVPGHCAGQIALLWPRRRALFAADVCVNIFGLADPLGFENIEEGRKSQRKLASCLIPGFDGASSTHEWKEALWARFYTGAPARQRSSVERYSIVKRA